MSSLLTQCPHCNTSFRVTEAQQQAAGGLVRCGSCLAVFSAADNEIRIKPPVQEQALADIEEFFENLDRENSENALAAPEETASVDDTLEPAIVFTLEEDTVPAETAATDHAVTEEAETVEPETEAMTAQSAPGELENTEELREELDLALPDIETFDVEVFEIEDADELTEHLEEQPAQHEEPYPAYRELEGYQDQHELPGAEVEATAEAGSESLPVAENPDTAVAYTDDANDSGTISLGDMQLDDVELDDEELAEAQQQIQPAEVAPAPRTSAEDKIQVREYLSTLADDDEPLEPVDDMQLDDLDEEPLTFVAPPRRSIAGTLGLFSLNLLLLAALGVQWLYWNRASLDAHPRFSFMAPYVCRVFSCPAPDVLPASDTLSSQQLLVRTHPRFPDALELSFIFNNDATTPQPFPNLELAFSDIDNQLLANRLFTPAEYLPAELQQFDEMPPQTSVQVVLELADPGEGAINYRISFHDP